jgi:hypothetical protein
MCNRQTTPPGSATTGLGGTYKDEARQQAWIKKRKLSTQEEEQRRSEFEAWQSAYGESSRNPFRILPKSRLMKIRKNEVF